MRAALSPWVVYTKSLTRRIGVRKRQAGWLGATVWTRVATRSIQLEVRIGTVYAGDAVFSDKVDCVFRQVQVVGGYDVASHPVENA